MTATKPNRLEIDAGLLADAAAGAAMLTVPAAQRLRQYLLACCNADGGFQGRDTVSDLYYTQFALSALTALRQPLPESVPAYLRSCGNGSDLDLLETSCLVRSWIMVPQCPRYSPRQRTSLGRHVRSFQAADGGFRLNAADSAGSVYALFLATLALEALCEPLPPAAQVMRALQQYRAADGGYANEPAADTGTTAATAAAALLLTTCGDTTAGRSICDWLLQRQVSSGGFCAHPALLDQPDLLSTATALHALGVLGDTRNRIAPACLAFVESLWSAAGGFRGSVPDPVCDCEYTFYGLLALGALA